MDRRPTSVDDGLWVAPAMKLARALAVRSSPRVEEKVEEVTVNLTEGTFGRLDGEVRPAVVDRGGSGFLARTTC
jgi:hypothetical protein